MATNKKMPSKRKSAKTEVNVSAAITSGQSAAKDVLAFRAKQLQRRKRIEQKLPETRRRGLGAPIETSRKARGLFSKPKTAGVLIAEGDSWFDYPMQDVLRLLEDDYLFDVESVAHKGDCVEDMAHSIGQFEEFATTREVAARRQSTASNSPVWRRQRHRR